MEIELTWSPDICIYHKNCADGFGAAWAIKQRWPDCSFEPGVYGKAPDLDITKMNVLLVDFSYKYPQLFDMSQQAASLVVIDHHKTAQADLAQIPSFDGSMQSMEEAFNACGEAGNAACWFDMNQSGATMAWQFAFPTEPIPNLLSTIEDRDLWKFELASTREISALIASYPKEFEVWDDLVRQADSHAHRANMIAEGRTLLRKFDMDVRQLIGAGKRTMVIGGHEVPVLNAPYQFASDAAGMMAQDAPFAATYYDRWDGQRSFSLRSRGAGGVDVSAIAKNYGGGGHRNAAGFTMPNGWEGERATQAQAQAQ